MATPGSQLVLQFQTEAGDKINFTYKYANPEVTSAEVKALVAAIVNNGSIYEKVPATAVSAVLQTTTQTAIDIAN